MAKIGIDVDGVLADFGSAFSEFARVIYGRDKIPAGYVPHDWNWSDVLTMDEQNVLWIELKKEKNFWTKLKPFEANCKALNSFASAFDSEHDIWFVTARAQCAGDTVTRQTSDWIRWQNNLGHRFRGVITVAKPPLKRQVLEGVGITYMIDDHGPTVEGLDQMEGMTACLLDRPWNQDAKVKHRVKDMAEFLLKVEPKSIHLELPRSNPELNLTQAKHQSSVVAYNTSLAR